MVDYILPGVRTFILWTLPPRRTCSDLSSSGHVAATCRVGGMTLESANTAALRALHWQQPWRRAAIIFKVALRAMLLEQLFPGGRWVENSQWNRSLLESDFLFRGKWAICINCCLVNLSLHWWYIPSECFWLFPGSFSSTQLQRTDSLPTTAAKIFIAVQCTCGHDNDYNTAWYWQQYLLKIVI